MWQRLTDPLSRHGILSFTSLALICLLGSAPLAINHAQAVTTNITSDGTLGTIVTPPSVTDPTGGNVYNIDGGTIIGGVNQFHSFAHLSVGTPTGGLPDIASFNGPARIQNVLGRVTGDDASNIDGTLRSTIPGANLFLMNPNGVVFGRNASLDIQGAFHATTADYVALGDGIRFNAAPSAADALLTTAAPAAFGFLNDNPAPISVLESNLQVPADETLSLIGGDIAISGGNCSTCPNNLVAPSGRIHLASVATRLLGTGRTWR